MGTNNNFLHTDRCGITVFGSSTVRVSPDSASIIAAVSRSETGPAEAFAAAKAAAAGVQDFLKEQGVRNFSSSRITLAQEYRIVNQAEKSGPTLGYKARIGFNIKVSDLDRVEGLVSGLVAAGANELQAVTYQSSLLPEMRNDARRQAIAAAKEKAELYCQEAGVSVGKVLAIDEVAAIPPGPKPPPQSPAAATVDPAEITVAANVTMTFEINREGMD
jgi:uncharacterized protein